MSDPGVRREVFIAAPMEAVFRLLTEAEQLVRWIGVAATIEAHPGGLFRFELMPGEFCSGRYVEVDPPRRVVFTWGWESGALPVPPGSSTVTIDLEPRPGGTFLRLIHTGLSDEMRVFHSDGWSRFLARLGAVAEGRDAGADPAASYEPGVPPALPGRDA